MAPHRSPCVWFRATHTLFVLLLSILSSAEARAQLGAVWPTSVTDTTIQVQWSDPGSTKYPYATNPPQWKLCWKKTWTFSGICSAGTTVTSSRPHTITGLQCDRTYKIRVEALTYKRKRNGNLVQPEFREIGTITVKTKECGSGCTGSLGAMPIGPGTIEARVEWSCPSQFEFVRIAYRRNSILNPLWLSGVSDRNTPPQSWGTNDHRRGFIDVYGFTGNLSVAFNGLLDCRDYTFVAHGFVYGSSFGQRIGKMRGARTPYGCRRPGLLSFLSTREPNTLGAYSQALDQHYAARYAPSYQVVHSSRIDSSTGPRLAVADAAGGVTFLDMNDPGAPSSVAHVSLSGPPRAMESKGTRTAIATSTELVLLEQDGAIIARRPMPASTQDVAVDTDMVLVAKGSSGAELHRSRLQSVQSLPIAGGARRVAFGGSAADLYVATSGGTLEVFRDLGGVVFPDSTYAWGLIDDIAVESGFVYCAVRGLGVIVAQDTGPFAGLTVIHRIAMPDVRRLDADPESAWLVIATANDIVTVDLATLTTVPRGSYPAGQSADSFRAVRGHVCIGGSTYDLTPNGLELASVYSEDAASVLKALASQDPRTAMGIAEALREGDSLRDGYDALVALTQEEEDLFGFLQRDPSLRAAGLDLESWLYVQAPQLLDDYREEQDIFERLSGGIAGTNGLPLITGSGELFGGDSLRVTLDHTNANSPTLLVMGSTRIDFPLFGGTLVPAPAITLPTLTDATGHLEVVIPWPNGVPADLLFYFQYWLLDPSAPQSFAASDGLQLTTR